MDDWQILGLEAPTEDAAAIRRVYALKLRVTRPDDDAAAYQALREAYDRLLAQARRASSRPSEAEEAQIEALIKEPIENVAPPAALPTQPEAPPEAVSPTPEQLCQFLLDACRTGGPALGLALKTLKFALDGLPLDRQYEASVRFADLVIANGEDLPHAVADLLEVHFGWRSDFRLARQLGPQRAEALLQALAGVVRPITDPEVLAQFSELRSLHRLLRAGGKLGFVRATLLSAMLGPVPERQLVAAATHRLLSALGVDVAGLQALRSLLRTAQWLRNLLLCAVLACLGLCVAGNWGDAFRFTIAAVAAALVAPAITLWALNHTYNRHLPRYRELFQRSVPVRQQPWLGILLLLISAGLGFMLQLADNLPAGFRMMGGALLIGLLVAGFAMALPPSPEQALVAVATTAYASAVIEPTQAWGVGLIVVWVLGGTQIYLQGVLDPIIGRIPLLAWASIGAPCYTAMLGAMLGHRFVIAALTLAGTSAIVLTSDGDTTATTMKLAAICAGAALFGLGFLQRKTIEKARRSLQTLSARVEGRA